MSQTERKVTARARYEALEGDRAPFLNRARECSRLTIPTLIPPTSSINGSNLPTPYQSIGAQGVKDMAAKLMLNLFPPNGSFFRLIVTDFDLQNIILQAASDEAQRTGQAFSEVYSRIVKNTTNEMNASLMAVEKSVVEEYEAKSNRATDSEILKHLIVAGNALRKCAVKKTEEPCMYPLYKYVVRRTYTGKPVEIVIKEKIFKGDLTEEQREALGYKPHCSEDEQYQEVDIYTWIRVVTTETGRKMWRETQEVDNVELPGTRSQYKLDESPWLPLRWNKIDGENYGRGHVEDLLGDLISCDGLRHSIVDAAAASARLLLLVEPGSPVDPKEITNAPNGTAISGNASAITALQINKVADLSVASSTASALQTDVGKAFLMATAIQRTGERVTATEIRQMVYELEVGLGGAYSVMAREYQLPLARMLMLTMQRQTVDGMPRLPQLPHQIQPTILTGVQALGRNADLERVVNMYQVIQTMGLNPQEVQMHLDTRGNMDRVATLCDVPTDGIFRDPQEVEQQMAQMAAAAAAAQPAEAGAQPMPAGGVSAA